MRGRDLDGGEEGTLPLREGGQQAVLSVRGSEAPPPCLRPLRALSFGLSLPALSHFHTLLFFFLMAYKKTRSPYHDYRSRCIYLITLNKGKNTPELSRLFGGEGFGNCNPRRKDYRCRRHRQGTAVGNTSQIPGSKNPAIYRNARPCAFHHLHLAPYRLSSRRCNQRFYRRSQTQIRQGRVLFLTWLS